MTTHTPRRFAIFGDIHGRVALMYTLAALYEEHTGHVLDAILQVGDMGAFPDHTRLDSATRSHAKRDPDELAFREFVFPTPEGERYLAPEHAPETLFIRGNHEDFEYLGRFGHPTPLDPWGKLVYLPDGTTQNVGGVCIAGFGGIAPVRPESEPRKRGRQARDKRRKATRKAANDPRRYAAEDALRAFRDADAIDILLTHDGPRCPDFPRGAAIQAALAERVQPRVHAFGHHHAVVHGTGPGESLLIGLDHLDWERGSGKLVDASWGILEIDPEQAHFDVATRERWPWLEPLSRHTYRYVLKNDSQT